MSLFNRLLTHRLNEAMADTPVVLLNGPRQAGKTTLAKQVAGDRYAYVTLDDETSLLAAQNDPTGFIQALDYAVIDEVQRAPALLLAIKKAIDEDRRPGRFLLTGSANIMALPKVADSLAGRMETLSLLPLAGCEINGGLGLWLPRVFSGDFTNLTITQTHNDTLTQMVLRGGYPESVLRTTAGRRSAWAKQYINALIQRDVRDIADIGKLGELPRLLKALAQMSGELCNFTQLAGQVGLDAKTAAKYLNVFEQMFLMRRIEPWSANRLSRVIKTPKIHFLDSGLLCYLNGLTLSTVASSRARFGHTLESYVYSELLKQASWGEDEYTIYHYRDKDKVEVDFVIEDQQNNVIGIEIKAASSVQQNDLAGLKKLATLAKASFKAGIVLYDGAKCLPLGNEIWAVPLSTLWKN